MFVVMPILILFLHATAGLSGTVIGLTTSAVASFALALRGILEEPITLIIAPVVLFGVVIAVFLEWRWTWSKWILIGLAVLLFIAASFAMFGAGGFFGFAFLALLVGSSISYSSTSRYATAAYIISTIGSSMRQNLPLPMALESAASGQSDKRSRILQRIKEWLVQGYSLSESLKRGYPKCPGFAVAMIAAAEQINQLPLAISSIEADMVAKADESRKIKPVHPLYPVIVVSFTFFVALALMIFVVPKVAVVLEEMFEVERLPVATQFLIQITRWLHGISILIWVALAFAFLVVIPLSIRVKFRPRRPQKPYLISRIGDFIKWHLPVLHWFEKNYSMVQVVELLRLSLNAGCTLNDAIANTLNLDVNNCFKKRLQKWLVKVEAGDNIATAAKESRLGNTLAWAFDERVNQGNTLAILETLESFYRSNYSYRVNLTRFVTWPCVTIIMGTMVAFVGYAFFSPGVAIITHLANLVTP